MPKTFFYSLLLVFALISCTHQPTKSPLVLSLEDFHCENCGTDILQILRTRSGVRQVTFDEQSASIELEFNPLHTTPEALMMLLSREGYPVKRVAEVQAPN